MSIIAQPRMASRASQALSKAFETRGAQSRLSERTGISQSRLSRLAKGGQPSLGTSQLLKNDTEIPIDPSWWSQPCKEPKRKRAA